MYLDGELQESYRRSANLMHTGSSEDRTKLLIEAFSRRSDWTFHSDALVSAANSAYAQDKPLRDALLKRASQGMHKPQSRR